MPTDPIGTVKRELLVRRLESWAPGALGRSRRLTFAQAYSGADQGAAEAALRVFVEYADRLRGRRVSVLTLAPAHDDLVTRLGAVEAELPAEVSVLLVPGPVDRLPVALRAAGAAGAPVLAYLDASDGPAPDPDALAAVAAARPGELLLALGPRARAGFDHRTALEAAGFPLVAGIELVAGDDTQLLALGTSAGKALDAFKDALWEVDEFAGVRYRDPRDPHGHLLDIATEPHPGPLRRELLARLVRYGPDTVTELRRFTAAETAFRASDTNRALAGLLAAGQVSRSPEHGRLGGDVLITAGPQVAAVDDSSSS
ncbi:MAG TPA: hypothetical protein VGD43_09845 [Micromonospora sp.]